MTDLELSIAIEDFLGEGCYIHIDVGGGSTEVSIFSKGELKSMRSFNIGTIRLLKDYVTNEPVM